MNLHGYPRVYNLGHAAVADLLLDDVVVEEKVDGSQMSTGVIDGELHMRSKGAIIEPTAPPKLFQRAVETFVRLAATGELHLGWTYRGECLDKPKHNTLAYDRVPRGNVIIFDVDAGDQAYLTPDDKRVECDRLGLECVPVLLAGRLASAEALAKLLATMSVLGGQTIEGVVVKNYHRFGRDGKALMGKHVSERFKEIHDSSWRVRNPTGKDVVGDIGDALRTEARWDKAVHHLRDAGELQDAPQDIGPLMKEVARDVLAEEADGIKERLFAHAWRSIHRAVTRGLPEWYKQRLVEKQFEGTTDDEVQAKE